ncbi:hypothetical protein GCM10022204_41410 [Microlunatus aurantiacus]|uniref:Uncharacterized protein n=1 Tax=Microlunatus aurantiacus TaxID=446786 RepID=A0ABP7EC65_9ACTN
MNAAVARPRTIPADRDRKIRPQAGTSLPRRPVRSLPVISAPRFGSWRAVAALVLTVVLAGVSAACTPAPVDRAKEPSPAAGAPVELDGTSPPPWPAPSDVAARVASAGLDLGPMGTAEHYHPHLRILIHGEEVPVPGNIGVDPSTGAMSALHTHEPDGTLHIEADTIGEVFTLGQLFTQWGVRLTATQIGGVRTETGQDITVTSNRRLVAGDPGNLRLQPDQQIVLQLP